MTTARDKLRRPLATLLVAVAAATAGASCGRIGSPKPPEYVIPLSPDPVTVESAPDGVKITWRRPKEYVGGDPLDDLAGFRVQRVCQPDAAFAVVATVPVEDRQRFRKASSFTMIDHDAPLGLSCRYQVIAFTLDDYTSPPAESEDIVRTLPGALP